MKIFTLLFSLLAVLFVKDSSALANPLTLPEPQGVYGVGMVNVELSDPTLPNFEVEMGAGGWQRFFTQHQKRRRPLPI
jgi:hypothetical protein